jgi:hypothetical protein
VTFARLTRGDWVAAVAALALLLVMAMDWYSTEAGVFAREQEQAIKPRGATAGEVSRAVDESARIAAEEAEDNAWQADPFPDRVILFALLATVALAIAAAFLRAARVRFEPPWTPSALATCVGLGAALLLAARIAQKPSADIGAVIKLGAPLGLVCLGTIVLGARAAWNKERDGSAWGEPGEAGEDAAHDPFADTDETDAIAKPPPLFDHSMEPDPEPAAEAQTATAVRPVVAEEQEDEAWAPDWSDPSEPAEPEPEPRAGDRSRRRRRGGRRGGKRRRRT